MRVGMVGLGKLGLPVAVAMADNGAWVTGYDVDRSRMTQDPQPYRETGPDGEGDFNAVLRACKCIEFGGMEKVVRNDIVFVAVQTPHHPMFEGTTPLPEARRDFDYTFLAQACRNVASYARDAGAKPVIAIISTVLPGTIRREIMPLLEGFPVVYNPSFIAMGTTMRDFLHPEFVLCGSDDKDALEVMRTFYFRVLGLAVANGRFRGMGIEDAEMVKVCYNTFISTKLAFANTVMEMCHRIPGANCDVVMDALKSADRRLVSRMYLSGGMGDGGGCHPRDNIAMSWLARSLGLRYDWFDAIMRQRQQGTEFLADLMMDSALPKAIIGYAFKARTNITTGSPALLLRHLLEARGVSVKMWDPHVDGGEPPSWIREPHVFLVGMNHDEFRGLGLHFSEKSEVIDPWRIVEESNGRTRRTGSLVSVGIGPEVGHG